eukprot:CAMPEP_0181361684 /NCGR_PEP_ID=MMETSP1106-20121128/7478_1 /TAXON_ID=81844 /ORGANISM="Mantoniella antarctica, Strain SL-175" /LENGTH=989 /DNA_ID=CAMNT_0023475335 /DNA_START=254 /DNA_END=3223 /DNA_ORIENTATION=-
MSAIVGSCATLGAARGGAHVVPHAAAAGASDPLPGLRQQPALHPEYNSAMARANLLMQLSDVKTSGSPQGRAAASDPGQTEATRSGSEGLEERTFEFGTKFGFPMVVRDPSGINTEYESRPLSGIATGEPVPFDALKVSVNGNQLMQIHRQTIPYNQFLRDLGDNKIKDIYWLHQNLDRYVLVYPDDRIAYCQVPNDDWKVTELINAVGIEVKPIIDYEEQDANSNLLGTTEFEANIAVFTQYGVPLIGAGIVYFIVWSSNRLRGDYDDRQKMMELDRRKEAMAKVEKNETLIALEDSMSKVDKELEPEVWAQMFKDADTLRRKLQTRARFMISAEGGGPGGGQKAGGGGGQDEAVDKFMQLGAMKVIGARDAGAEDAVGAAMAAAKEAKGDDDAKKAAKAEAAGMRAKDIAAACGESDEAIDKGETTANLSDDGGNAAKRTPVPGAVNGGGSPGGGLNLVPDEKSKSKSNQGKLRSKMQMRDESDVVLFKDVAGIGDAKIELAEIVDFFRRPEKFKASGAKVPKGVMLTGPPGCGKTLLARAVAGESGATFFSITASEFVEMFVGVGAARVRDLFSQAKKQAPSIIFIDELDAIGRPRGGGGSGNDERDQTLNQLLVELDGFGSESGVVCIAATNRVDVLDKALVRAGRFDRKITVVPPTREGRLQILKVHVRDKPLAADVDLADLADEMSGFTGAIVANMVNVACLTAARQGRDDICQANFDAAVEAEQFGKVLPMNRGIDNDRRLARVHAGCAVATRMLMSDVCRLNFVTIVPRETNFDGSVNLKDFPEIERPNVMTRAILSRHTRTCFVPQLAEEEHYGFDNLSAAAAPYTARAREIASLMVMSSGMAAPGSRLNFVPVTDSFMVSDFLRSDHLEFLLRSTYVSKYFESDREVREMLEREHRAARRFVRRQKAAIDAVTDALVEHKTVNDTMLEEIFARTLVPEPDYEEEVGVFPPTPENRTRLVPSTAIMPEGSVPATTTWIET